MFLDNIYINENHIVQIDYDVHIIERDAEYLFKVHDFKYVTVSSAGHLIREYLRESTQYPFKFFQVERTIIETKNLKKMGVISRLDGYVEVNLVLTKGSVRTKLFKFSKFRDVYDHKHMILKETTEGVPFKEEDITIEMVHKELFKQNKRKEI